MPRIDEINEMLPDIGINIKVASEANLEVIEELVKKLDILMQFALEVKDSDHIPTFAAAKLALFNIDEYKYKL